MTLDFIRHLRGSVIVDAMISCETVLDGVESWLVKQQKPITKSEANYVAFNDPLWRNLLGPNWLALVIYDRGQFWIEQGHAGRLLHYEIRSLHGMVFCLCGAAMFFLFWTCERGPR